MDEEHHRVYDKRPSMMVMVMVGLLLVGDEKYMKPHCNGRIFIVIITTAMLFVMCLVLIHSNTGANFHLSQLHNFTFGGPRM